MEFRNEIDTVGRQFPWKQTNLQLTLHVVDRLSEISVSDLFFFCDPYGHECPHVQPLCPSGKLERGSLPGGGKTHDQFLWAGNEL